LPRKTFNRVVGSLADGRLYEFVKGGLHPVGPIDPELSRGLVQSGEVLAVRVQELETSLANSSATDAQPAAAQSTALGQLRALTNELQRGLATLRTIGAMPNAWPVPHTEQLTESGTLMVAGALDGLARVAPAKLAPDVVAAVAGVRQAGAEHAKLAAALEQSLPRS
jgi:hypothetical protein